MYDLVFGKGYDTCLHFMHSIRNFSVINTFLFSSFNTELNDLRKSICSEKLKNLFKEFQFIKPLKIWWGMADIVRHSPPNFQ